MNESTVLIPTSEIGNNPWQPRAVTDPAAVEELANNIETNGLLQPPTVRELDPLSAMTKGCKYELAFGHTRLAAFKFLANVGKPYYEIPCFVRPLTDLQMFELALAENIKRRDLNPIEQATAMQRYMKDFGKTSVEAAVFFNVNQATVRGTVRLLNLPESAKDAMRQGKINVGQARTLLTVSRVVPVGDVIQEVEEGKDLGAAIGHKLGNNKNVVKMWESYYRDGDGPKGGYGLWKLTERFAITEKLTPADAKKALGLEKDELQKKDLAEIISQLESGLVAVEAMVNQAPGHSDTIERLALLIDPPDCASCPLHFKTNGSDYCTWKFCWQRKCDTWCRMETEKLSQETGIPVYDPGQDGEFRKMNKYGKDQELFKDKDAGLRLVPDYTESSWQHVPDSYCVEAVDVNLERVNELKESEARGETDRERYTQEQKVREEERKEEQNVREIATRFVAEVAAPVFSVAFDKLPDVLIPPLFRFVDIYAFEDDEFTTDKDGNELTGAEEIKRKRVGMAAGLLEDTVAGWEARGNGVMRVAEACIGAAKDWGVKLPIDWMQRAAEFKPVSTETEEEDEEI